MNQSQNMELLFKKNIVFVDKNTKNELKKFEYIQNYEEEKFVKQKILYKEKSIEILKEKIIYVDKLNEISFLESGYFDDNRKKELEVLQRILEQFNKVN